MSEESHHLKAQRPRTPKPEELAVLRMLIATVAHLTVAGFLVQDMSDGGMGSIRFIHSEDRPRVFDKVIAEAEFVDTDGVLVSIALNVDNFGDLYEIDFWKVDFSPLCAYPSPEQLRVKNLNP